MDDFLNEIEELRLQGLDRLLPLNDGSFVNFSSNDYLGLSHHPKVKKAAQEAIELYGVGGTSSRLLAGTKKPHSDLETDLARFFKKDKALVFSTGYQANVGIMSALLGPADVVFFDRLSHASIIDGIKISGVRFYSFEHNNLVDLEKKLKAHRAARHRSFIVTESVFSMDGDVAPIKQLMHLAKLYDSLMYVDEAHAVGLFGEDGRGIASEAGCLDNVDIIVGTLSKTLGSQGGYIASRNDIIDLLVSKSRSFIYTTSLAPACAAAARAALALFPSLETERQNLSKASEKLRASLNALGWSTLKSSTQIIPVLTQEVEATKKLSAHLFQSGFFVPSIRPPTVPKGKCRLRLSVTSDVLSHCEKLVEALKKFS